MDVLLLQRWSIPGVRSHWGRCRPRPDCPTMRRVAIDSLPAFPPLHHGHATGGNRPAASPSPCIVVHAHAFISGTILSTLPAPLTLNACPLNSRAIREMSLNLDFPASGDGTSSHYVRGVGGEGGDSVRVRMVDLPRMEMAGVGFDKVGRGGL
eukprot:250177-Chlamydomonas_euryale.AAC.1